MYEMEGPFAPPGRASEPMTRRPVRCPAATGYQAPQEFAGRPAPPRVPWVSPGTGPPSVVRDFLLPVRRVAQGVRRVNTRFFSLSTGRVALIHRSQRQSASYPQRRTQPERIMCSGR